jgi:hypothetical protein
VTRIPIFSAALRPCTPFTRHKVPAIFFRSEFMVIVRCDFVHVIFCLLMGSGRAAWGARARAHANEHAHAHMRTGKGSQAPSTAVSCRGD